MKLSKENTKILQGIAILCMFGLHLFNRANWASYYDLHLFIGKTPLLLYVSYIFDACVPIYLFCSGYGLYVSEKNHPSTFKIRVQRIMKLLVRFWLILGITCIIGYCMGMKETYPGSLLNFILNALLIKSSYVGAFWFVQTYTLLVLLSGIIYKLVKKNSYLFIGIYSLALYVLAFAIEYLVLGRISVEGLRLFVNAVMLLFRSQFSFIIGMILANETVIDDNRIFSKIRNNKLLVWFLVIGVIFIRGQAAHMIFAPFSAIVLIVVLGTHEWGNIGKNMLLFFGNHSTNMWLVHMQFYMIFTPKLVFGFRNVFIIMLTLIGVSVATSYVVNYIYAMLEKISMFCTKEKDIINILLHK